jgi:serine/threonine protein phosphatase PrpC
MSVDRIGKSAYSVTVSQEQLAEARKLAEQRVVSGEAIDQFLQELRNLRARGFGERVPGVFEAIQPPPDLNRGHPDQIESARSGLKSLLVGAGLTLSKLYQDRTLDVLELDQHLRTGQILEMFDAVKGLIPPPRMRRLEQELFAPIRNIAQNAAALSNQTWQQIHDPALRERLANPGRIELKELKPSDLEGHSLRGIDRYGLGDLVRVGGSKGFEIGEVIGVAANHLEVAVLRDGEVGKKPVSKQSIEGANPLKLGDWFPSYSGSIEPGGPRGWNVGVTGLTADGGLEVQAKQPGSQQWILLTPRQIEHVASTLARQLGLAAPGSIEREPDPVPLRDGRQVLNRAGGVQMLGVESFEGEKIAGSLFTDRGIGYASYNEDAVSIGRFASDKDGRSEVSFSISCDQAGGEGKIVGEDGQVLDGEASRIATKWLERAAESIWLASKPGFVVPKVGGPDDTLVPGTIPGDPSAGTDPRQTLLAAVKMASDEISAKKVDSKSSAVTTASAVVVKDGVAYGINIGDSAVLHFDKAGRLKNTGPQDSYEMDIVRQMNDPNAGLRMSSAITRALGQPDDLELDRAADTFAWKLDAGDYLVTATDGLLDANLEAQKKSVQQGVPWTQNHGDVTNDQIGALARVALGADDLARSLLDYTTTAMTLDDRAAFDRASAAFREAEARQDGEGMNAARAAIQLARGSGKPDNRGFGVLQYLG